MIDKIALIKKHEGKSIRNHRHMPYQDTVGKWTIGYGRNISDCGISEEEAQLLLANDIKQCEEQLDHNLPWWREKPEAVQFVMLDMTFNMGITIFLTFVRTLELLKDNKFIAVADNLTRTKWYKQVGIRGVEDEQLLRGCV